MEINILEYEALVYSIINKYSNYSRDDLYQVGMLALVEACKNYKSGMGAKFSTYAYFYVKGAVREYVRLSKSVKVSRDTLKLASKIEKAREMLRQKLSREPSDYELSVFLEIDMDTISKVNDATFTILSLDSTDFLDDNSYYNSVKVEDENLNTDFIDLSNAILELDPTDQQIIYDRYFNGYTQSEISNNLGISQVQVSRKEAKILQKLKVKL